MSEDQSDPVLQLLQQASSNLEQGGNLLDGVSCEAQTYRFLTMVGSGSQLAARAVEELHGQLVKERRSRQRLQDQVNELEEQLRALSDERYAPDEEEVHDEEDKDEAPESEPDGPEQPVSEEE